MSPASRPAVSGRTRLSNAALVVAQVPSPKPSPQPTMPSSVSTRIRQVSIVRQRGSVSDAPP